MINISQIAGILWRTSEAADTRALLDRPTGHRVVAWSSPDLWHDVLGVDLRLEAEGGSVIPISPGASGDPAYELQCYLHTSRNEVRIKVPGIPAHTKLIAQAHAYAGRIDPDKNQRDEYVLFLVKTLDGQYYLRGALLSLLASGLQTLLKEKTTGGRVFPLQTESEEWGIWLDGILTRRDLEPVANNETDLPTDGVEDEDTGIARPFNPALINIQSRQFSLDTIIKRIREGEINLAPDFQRNEVWKLPAKSRLIESLLIRIPLPAFYMDATDDDRWLVVDGLQRLSTLRDFIVAKTLRLQELEFLSQFEGKSYDELPRNYQRRIEETQITIYLIEKGTPSDVKFNIFKRINTGGLPLSPQEIRHALHQGWVTRWLADMAKTPEFLAATDRGIKDQRMTDRECVLRYAAFKLTPFQQYNAPDVDGFLSDTMGRLNGMAQQERSQLTSDFLRAMEWARRIFDRSAFRKQDSRGKRYPINKALFEVWSVNLDRLSNEQLAVLERRAVSLQKRFARLGDDAEFLKAISQGTGDPAKVRLRFGTVQKLIEETL